MADRDATRTELEATVECIGSRNDSMAQWGYDMLRGCDSSWCRLCVFSVNSWKFVDVVCYGD